MYGKKKYLIFAHYHSNGLLRNDILNFLSKSKKIFTKIIFISTNIKQKEFNKIPKKIKTIRRENFGYDFSSYKVGLDYLIKLHKVELKNSILYFVNSSILFIEPDKILKKISKLNINKNELWGISRSFEMTDHIQSYFFFFSSNLLDNKKIINWWKKIRPLKTHFKVMFKYELGLSKIMLKNHVNLRSIYKKNTYLKTNNIFKKIPQRFNEIFFKTPKYYKKDPTWYFWKDFYNLFGIVKIKLLKGDKKKFNLDKLYNLLKKKKILIDALNN